MDWCGNNTAKWLQGEEPEVPAAKAIKKGPAPNLQYDDNEPHCHPPCLGDVVAVPFQDQEHGGSDFWLGKCLRLNEDGTMLLGWFQEVGKNSYRMKIGASWQEVCVCVFLPSSSCFSSLTTPPLSFSPPQNIKACIYPIDVKYSEVDHTYTLLTPTEDILETQ